MINVTWVVDKNEWVAEVDSFNAPDGEVISEKLANEIMKMQSKMRAEIVGEIGARIEQASTSDEYDDSGIYSEDEIIKQILAEVRENKLAQSMFATVNGDKVNNNLISPPIKLHPKY